MNKAELLLNPRTPQDVARAFTSAWNRFVKSNPEAFTAGTIGIATSGSTDGVGSIIVLSREALEVSARAVNRRLLITDKDVWGLALPFFHVGGYSIPVRASLSESRVVDFTAKWDAGKFHAWLVQERVTLLSLVPTQLFDLIEAEFKSPPALRALVIGGGRLEPSLHDRAVDKGWPVLQSYGLTECASQVATALPLSDGTVLDTLDHIEVKTDRDRRLMIRSRALLTARIVFDRQMSPTLEFPVDDNGWFKTADRGLIKKTALSDGMHHHVTILGRDGDEVKVLGEMVNLVRVRSTIEQVISENPALKALQQRTFVVAIPAARRGHELVLVCEKAGAAIPSTMLDTLFTALVSRLAPFETPFRTAYVDAIPRSNLGKVLTTLLTEEIQNQGPGLGS